MAVRGLVKALARAEPFGRAEVHLEVAHLLMNDEDEGEDDERGEGDEERPSQLRSIGTI
jgi:hypothetical protein